MVKGRRRLEGSIKISGAKNAALPIIVASLLTKEKVIIHNVPRLGDVYVVTELARSVGTNIKFKENTICIRANKLNPNALSNSVLARKIRYSTLFVGALLAQFKKIQIPLPGGCVIGTRRLDSHVLGLTKLGAKINIKRDYLEAVANELSGCHIVLEYPSVSATENIVISACLAKGISTIENAAKEPEIVDLTDFLNSMGSEIEGAGTSRITIKGVEELSGTEYSIIPDRIETGTYMVVAALTEGKIILQNTDLSLVENVVAKLRESGMNIEKKDGGLEITSNGVFHPLDIVTEVYPGFPTDMQPIITPLLSVADGESTIKETIFDQRFTHVPELRKMGAKIDVTGNTISIEGTKTLRGSEVHALDIRAGGSLIAAGLFAKGVTTINGACQISRGYEKLVEKLKNVGAQLKYVRATTKSFG